MRCGHAVATAEIAAGSTSVFAAPDSINRFPVTSPEAPDEASTMTASEPEGAWVGGTMNRRIGMIQSAMKIARMKSRHFSPMNVVISCSRAVVRTRRLRFFFRATAASLADENGRPVGFTTVATRRPVAFVLAAGLFAAACGGSTSTDTDATAADEGDRPATTAAPQRPVTDLDTASVPLSEILFDTFNGGSLPLSEASPERIEQLLDAIPPIYDPSYVDVGEDDWLDEDDLVLGYVAGDGTAYAYPHKILNFREIVNDELADLPVLVTFCPLCRSGVVFDRRVDGNTLTFGNTSALYQNDMVMTDHETRSYWWQVAGRALVGSLTDQEMAVLPSATMRWDDWVELYPATRVLDRAGRDYSRDPFGGYAQSVNEGRVPFPVDDEHFADQRLPSASLVLGVETGDVAAVYGVESLSPSAVNDDVGDQPVVVFGISTQSAAAYDPTVAGERLTFVASAGDERTWIDDQTGSEWNGAGLAVGGELTGTQLALLPSRSSFWFAYRATHPEAEVRFP